MHNLPKLASNKGIPFCQSCFPSMNLYLPNRKPVQPMLFNYMNQYRLPCQNSLPNFGPITGYNNSLFQDPKKILKSQFIGNHNLKKTSKKEKNDDNSASKKEKCQRKKFSSEEDEQLRDLVEQMGSRKWDQIAKQMPGRTGRQCRDRYQNYLIPGFFNGQWSRQEDNLLMQKYMEFGPQWSKMKPFFSNRSANSLKNRWNYFVSKHIHDIGISNIGNTVINNPFNCYSQNDIIDADDKSDIIYENVINYPSSIDFIDFDLVDGNDDFQNKDDFADFSYTSNDNC